MRYMYATSADLKKIFHCGNSTVQSCRRYIADNPERYTNYGVVRNLTNLLAFADAYKYRGLPAGALPPFEPESVAALLGGEYGQL